MSRRVALRIPADEPQGAGVGSAGRGSRSGPSVCHSGGGALSPQAPPPLADPAQSGDGGRFRLVLPAGESALRGGMCWGWQAAR